METRRAAFVASIAFAIALTSQVRAQQPPNPAVVHSHSLESDLEDPRLSDAKARLRAAERVGWRDDRRMRDPLVHIKLLGINDFHGQLAAGRFVGVRPVGSAAVLAAYLKDAVGRAEDGYLVVHAGDHVGASPPDSALLQDEPSISFLNGLANSHCRYVDVAQGPWNLSYAQPLCNLVGTLGNHEFDDGVTELVAPARRRQSSEGPVPGKALARGALPLRERKCHLEEDGPAVALAVHGSIRRMACPSASLAPC